MSVGNFEVDFAFCVDEAIKKLSTGNYDCVVSDYEMPQKDGLQFLKELRKQNNKIPFILFTGKGREEVAIMALNLGADGYYDKHGTTETVYGELAHGIRQSVEHKQTETELKQLEWLLIKTATFETKRQKPENHYTPPYGNLAEISTCRLLTDSVGESILLDMMSVCALLCVLYSGHSLKANRRLSEVKAEKLFRQPATQKIKCFSTYKFYL